MRPQHSDKIINKKRETDQFWKFGGPKAQTIGLYLGPQPPNKAI